MVARPSTDSRPSWVRGWPRTQQTGSTCEARGSGNKAGSSGSCYQAGEGYVIGLEHLFTRSHRKSQARKHRKGRSKEKDMASDSDSSNGKRGCNAARRGSKGCYECHEIGRIARFCPKKRPVETTGIKKRLSETTDTAAIATTIEHYFMAIAGPVSLQTLSLFVDGGCTAHICGEREKSIQYTEYGKSEEREISDFTSRVACKAIEYGDARLRLRQPGRRKTRKVVVVRNVLHVCLIDCSLLFITRYLWPEVPRQRLAAALAGNGGLST